MTNVSTNEEEEEEKEEDRIMGFSAESLIIDSNIDRSVGQSSHGLLSGFIVDQMNSDRDGPVVGRSKGLAVLTTVSCFMRFHFRGKSFSNRPVGVLRGAREISNFVMA